MTLKADDFVVDGLTDDERAALAEGAEDDAADAKEAGAETEADKAAANADTPAVDTKEADAAAAAATKKAADDAAAKKATDDAAAKKAADDEAAKNAGDDGKAADATADAKDGKDAKTEGAEAAETTDETPAPRQTLPDWKAPADAKERLAEITTKRDALGDKADNGEITLKQLTAELSALDQEQRQIERAVDRAEMASEMRLSAWLGDVVPAFLDANKHYSINPTLNAMLDTEVKRLQVEASKAGKNQFDPAILATADKAIKASLLSLGVKPAEGQGEGAGDGKKPPAQGKPGKPTIPPTLATLPAANIEQTGDPSKYAALDRLADKDPEAYEAAFARLPEAERDAYLSR